MASENGVFGAVSIGRISIRKTVLQRSTQPHANQAPGCVLRRPANKALLHPLMTAHMPQYHTHEVYQQHLLQLVNTLLILVARNLARNRSAQLTENTT
jgi:hypothetical protein